MLALTHESPKLRSGQMSRRDFLLLSKVSEWFGGTSLRTGEGYSDFDVSNRHQLKFGFIDFKTVLAEVNVK